MNINANELRKFIVSKLKDDKLEKGDIKKYDIDEKVFEDADKDEDTVLDLDDEILRSSKLYDKFATMYLEEKKELDDNGEKEEDKAKVKEASNKSGV